MSIRVGIADDHRLVCEGIKQLIEYNGEVSVIFETHDGIECLEIMENSSIYIDVLLLDVNMPLLSGFEVLKEIKNRKYTTRVLILTVHDEIEFLVRAIDFGADGYLLKDSGSNELIKAIRTLKNGETYIQPSLVPLLNSYLVQKDIEHSKIELLTNREKEVLVLASSGFINKEIADQMKISERTVKNHMSNIFKKIDVSDRTQAAVFAIKNNLLQIS